MTTERNHSTRSKINHSGNIPDQSMRETPLNPNMPLKDIEGSSITIPNSGEGFIDPIQHENGLRRFLRTGLGKASVIGASLLTAGGIVGGITESMHHNETPVQAAAPSHLPKASHSEKANPGASATPSPSDLPTQPTAESTPLVLPQPLSPAEQQIDSMSVAQFDSLDIKTKVGYVGALIGGTAGLQEYAKEYESTSQNPQDILPAVISVNNTPQEIATVATYAERLTLSFSGDQQQKVENTILMHGSLSDHFSTLDPVVKQDPAGENAKQEAYNDIFHENFSNLTASAIQYTEDNTPYVSISGNDDGKNFSTNIYYISTTYDGEPFNLWIQS